MQTIYHFKSDFQKLLHPVLVKLHAQKITPNHLTMIALAGSLFVGLLIGWVGRLGVWLWVCPVWLFVRMALNALDGMMAREFAMQSRQGFVLNEVGDVVSDAALYLPFMVIAPSASWPIILFVLGGILTEFSGLLGQAMGGKRHYEGPMGKSDRAFLVGALVLVSTFNATLLLYWGWIFLGGAVLTAWTCLNRISASLKECAP